MSTEVICKNCLEEFEPMVGTQNTCQGCINQLVNKMRDQMLIEFGLTNQPSETFNLAVYRRNLEKKHEKDVKEIQQEFEKKDRLLKNSEEKKSTDDQYQMFLKSFHKMLDDGDIDFWFSKDYDGRSFK